jgi:hypothetical protein
MQLAKLGVAVFTGIMGVTIARSSSACWDGYAAGSERVSLQLPGDANWDPNRVRQLAKWLTRLDALLASDQKLESFGGYASLTSDSPTGIAASFEWDGQSLSELFGGAAKAIGDPRRQRAALRQGTPPVYTVQVFASSSSRRAEQIAESISRSEAAVHGFVAAGGWPADNPEAHVVAESVAGGKLLHKVVVGAFLDVDQARKVARDLSRETKMPSFVRQL